MSDGEQFPYVAVKNSLGEIATRPILPVTLAYRGLSMDVNGLLDTGSDVNVLPYQLGLQLGGVWEQARTGLRRSGNLAQYEARGILLTCTVGQLPPVQLAFAWTQAEQVPLLFGQVNFFAEFEVCFYRARQVFRVREREITDDTAQRDQQGQFVTENGLLFARHPPKICPMFAPIACRTWDMLKFDHRHGTTIQQTLPILSDIQLLQNTQRIRLNA